uniref:Uncharacterized protein n=1 Tax=Arundo donax TaxID=35708 RepID=A0A0A9BYB9_ARUDO
MSKDLFLRIANAVEAHCSYFQQKRNAVGDRGNSAVKKVMVALHMIANGGAADSYDGWLNITDSTNILCCEDLHCLSRLAAGRLHLLTLRSMVISTQWVITL